MFGRKREVFADNASGSPINLRVRGEMRPWLDASWNPSAIHPRGLQARRAIEEARKSIATLLYAHADEITFTASGTESLHLALHSVLNAHKGSEVPHVITTPIEHHALLEQLHTLAKEGKITLDFMTLLQSGVVDPASLKSLLRPSTALVAVMYANNEIGTIQPIRDIAKIVRDYKKIHRTSTPYVLTDACQAFSSLDVHMERLGVDYLVLNGAKVSGPQGSALLFTRRGAPLVPILLGGGQESGHRAGTENVAGIIGLGKALELAQDGRVQYEKYVSALRNELEKKILTTFPDAHINGTADRLPGHLNITFPGVDHQYLALALGEAGIMIGTKSACRENDDGDSHVLQALREAGDGVNLPAQGIRISLGLNTTSSDISMIYRVLQKVIPLAQKSRTIIA